MHVYILISSVVVFAIVAFFFSTLVAARLNRQPLTARAALLFAMASVATLFAMAMPLVDITGPVVALAASLLVTQTVLTYKLMPRLVPSGTAMQPAPQPAPVWRFVVTQIPLSILLLGIVGTLQMLVLSRIMSS